MASTIKLIQKGDLASSSFSNDNSNNAGGVKVRVDTGSDVKTAIDAAITTAVANLPADIYVNGLSSYDAATNILTLTLSNGTTVPLNMTNLVADAVASAQGGLTVQLFGNDETTSLGYIKP